MGKGNKLMRVAPEFSRIVSELSDNFNITSAEVTRQIAGKMKRLK